MSASFIPAALIRNKRWLVFFWIAYLSLSVQGQTTLYTYQSGSWDNIDVWTTDPGGTTLVGSRLPGNGDAVVILPSRTISLAADVSSTGLSLTIQAGGVLDAVSFTFTSNLASFNGQGTYRLSSAGFPSATTNGFVLNGGGTAEYYNGADFNLPTSQASYFNLKINCGGSVATQLGNLTVYGDLIVRNGNYRINDGTAARRTLVINGNIEVSAGAFVTVGTGNTTTTTDPTGTGNGGTAPFLDYYVAQAHRIEIFGNLTNNGTVRFTNQSFPVFNAFPNNGMASVFFRGATDKTLTCNGQTDFYNLIIDKGIDQTFTLTVNSADYNKFRIFGANVAGEFAGSDPSNPNIRKALWIRNGTLKLNGRAIIPSLAEGASSGSGDFIIPGNGALILGGPDVVVMGTIDDYSAVDMAYGVGGSGAIRGVTTGSTVVPSGISLFGKLQVNEGKLYIGELGRIVYYGSSASAQFIINGGIVDIKQFQSVSGGGKTAFWQTGGRLVLRGRFRRSLLFSSLTDMISSIGASAQLNTARLEGPDPGSGTLNLDQDANIFHMEGGYIDIYDVTGSSGIQKAIEINSDPSNVSVTGGDINIYLTSGTGLADIDYGIASKSPLYNLNITLSSGSGKAVLLTIPAKSGVTAVASPPLRILNNLALTNPTGIPGTLLDASGFDLRVGGNFLNGVNSGYSPGNNRTILNGSGAQTFTNNGTITSGLYRFIVDKNSGTATLGSDLSIRDSLAIFSGALNDGGFIVNVSGNVYNGGTHSGNGYLRLNGTSVQYLSASVEGSATLGNVEITNSTGSVGTTVVKLLSNFAVESLTMTSDRVLYIDSHTLTVGAGGISQALTYSRNRMIKTSGLSSAGGLKRFLNNSYSSMTVLYPVGCRGGSRDTATNYFPGRLITGNISNDGYYTVVPVSGYHPSCNVSKQGDALDFYWKTKISGLNITGTRHVEFDYSANIPNQYNDPYYLLSGSSTWGTAAGNNNSRTLVFPTSIGITAGEFTSGKNNPFRNPRTYYSRQSGAWNAIAGATYPTWSLTGHTGTAVPASEGLPENYDNVIIGGVAGRNDSVTVTSSIRAAIINIRGSYTSDSRSPVLNIQSTTGHTIDIIRGAGKFCTSTRDIPDSPTDFGDFLANDTAVFQYYGNSYTLPGISSYPNLLLTGNSTKTLMLGNTIVRKDLIIADEEISANTLRLNSAGGNLTIYGDVKIKDGGRIIIPASATAGDISIYGDIDFRYGKTLNNNSIEAESGSGIVHKINFYGHRIWSGASNLSFNQAGTNKADFYIKGSGNVLIVYGTGTFSLNRLFIQKDVVTDTVFFRNNFTLNETGNNTASKSLNPGTGILVLSDPSNLSASTINLNLSSGGTNYFLINSSSGIILRNGSLLNITGNSAGSGLKLDGLLKAEGSSSINFANASGTNNGYVEYTGSGNAILDLSGSATMTAGQIRRSLTLSTGLLKYAQSGSSSVTIYGIENTGYVDLSRAKLEITGSGSLFNMSGTSVLSIVNGGGTSYGDLYIRPESSAVTGGTIIFGSGVSGKQYKIDASVPVNNLTITTSAAANELQIMVNPLVLNGTVTIDNPCILRTNGINLTVKGNMINNGTYIAGSNTTTFSGSTQTISGSNDPLFMNLTVSPSVKLTPLMNLSVSNNLNITGGTLESTSFSITVSGNVFNNGAYTNDPAGTSRLFLNGTTLQHIGGTGSFGRIELDNPAAGAKLDNNLALTEDIKLTNGIFDINQFSLTLGTESDIVPVAFGATRMFRSDGVYSNGGITKYFNAGYSGTFTWPFGVSGKYTPASLQIITTGAGYVRINSINEKHPATLAPFNVLNYYWDVESTVADFDGTLQLSYAVTDVTGDESQYVAGRLIVPPGTGWSKAAAGPTTDNVNETTHVITFVFPSGTSNLGGQFTAGYTSDLPNSIPVYRSKNPVGNWNVKTDWNPESPDGGPNGCVVIIEAGTVMNASTNKRFAYTTTINGTLNVGTTYGHNLGTVSGAGTLSLQQANLPAGDFSSFLRCSGGTLEYDGGSYTIVADRIDTVRNLIFKGTGTKSLPDKDLVICNLLEINGPVLDNHFNRKLSVGGSFILTAGSFAAGSGAGATVTFNGSTPQAVSGFNSSSPLNNLEINNSSGLTLGSDIDLNGNLLLTSGIISTGSYKIRMLNQSAVSSGGSSSSFVNGILSKNQFGGVTFIFHVGKGTRYGKIGLINPQSGTWEAEYFNTNFGDPDVDATLINASASEYWKVTSPADAKTASVQLRWDNLSDINPMTTSGGITDIRVAEYTGTLWTMKPSSAPVGDNNNGTVQTSANITINRTTHPYYYTLGSVSAVKPTITLGVMAPVCRCFSPADLPYIATTGLPDQYTIDFDAAANAAGFVDVTSWTAFSSSPIPVIVPSSATAGIYNATIRVRKASVLMASIPYSFSVIVLAEQQWSGTSGTDWATGGNWLCGFLPDAASPVRIPAVTNKPIINAATTASVNNLTINTGSSLVVNGILQISGTITNDGSLTAASGRIVLNGSAAQTIGSGIFTGNTVKDLTVNNIAGVSLGGPLKVTGILKMQSGNMASSGNLTLVSNSSGTALIDGTGTGNVLGNITMQRFLPSKFGYKYFSSPFQSATVSQFADEVNLTNWFPLFYAYDENRNYLGTPLEPFYNYSDPANVLVPMAGYAANFGAVTDTLTVDATGIVNNGSYSMTLFNNNHLYSVGRNLVGNPYPSPIDWNSPLGWTKTNIDNALYYFKASTTDEWGGTYSSWINGVSSDGVASNIIPSMQGFLVHVADGAYPVTGTLSMDNQVRVTNMTQPFYKKSYNADDKLLVRLSASFSDQSRSSDPLVIYFDEKATPGFDNQFDALKYFNTDYDVPNIFSFSNDHSKLSINALPSSGSNIPVIPLGVKIMRSGEVIFRMKDLSGPYYIGSVNLHDAATGKVTDLSTGDEYRISLNEGDYFDRFFLTFEGYLTGGSIPDSELLPLKLYSSQGKVFAEISSLAGSEGMITISNLTGQTLFTEKVYENGHHVFNPDVNEGIYIVSFITGNIRHSEKIYIKGR